MTGSHALGRTLPLARARVGVKRASPEERLGILLLPARLDAFGWAEHARRLLAIPRVIALEPGRFRTPGFLRDALPLRQAKRLRLPGRPRILVLYRPAQYPLARALRGRYDEAELWYLRESVYDPAAEREVTELDQLIQERAATVCDIARPEDLDEAEEALRRRLSELGVINHRPFLPGGPHLGGLTG